MEKLLILFKLCVFVVIFWIILCIPFTFADLINEFSPVPYFIHEELECMIEVNGEGIVYGKCLLTRTTNPVIDWILIIGSFLVTSLIYRISIKRLEKGFGFKNEKMVV